MSLGIMKMRRKTPSNLQLKVSATFLLKFVNSINYLYTIQRRKMSRSRISKLKDVVRTKLEMWLHSLVMYKLSIRGAIPDVLENVRYASKWIVPSTLYCYNSLQEGQYVM